MRWIPPMFDEIKMDAEVSSYQGDDDSGLHRQVSALGEQVDTEAKLQQGDETDS